MNNNSSNGNSSSKMGNANVDIVVVMRPKKNLFRGCNSSKCCSEDAGYSMYSLRLHSALKIRKKCKSSGKSQHRLSQRLKSTFFPKKNSSGESSKETCSEEKISKMLISAFKAKYAKMDFFPRFHCASI